MTSVETAPSLYACVDCDKFLVLSGSPDECPDGHAITLVTPDSAYAYYGTCGNAACSHALGLTMTIEDGRCDHCRKHLGSEAGELVAADGTVLSEDLAKLVYVAPREAKGSHAARSLEDALDKAEGFTTSHHKDRKGHHSANASATHARGDQENAQVRKKKREMLLKLIRKLEESSTYDPAEHDKLIQRAMDLANKWK